MKFTIILVKYQLQQTFWNFSGFGEDGSQLVKHINKWLVIEVLLFYLSCHSISIYIE